MERQASLISALLLDGTGGSRALDWQGVRAWHPGQGLVWVHLWRDGAEARDWLMNESGLDEIVAEALLADETRPRCTFHDPGVLLNLRGVNLNPGAEPEDMVSIRLWIEPKRVVSVRLRRLTAVHAMQEALRAGRGVRDLDAFLVALAGGLVERMEPVIAELGDGIDALEDEMLQKPARTIRTRLSELRRQTIALRRYIAPQRDALAQFIVLGVPWLHPSARARLREVADGVTRIVEELDATRERASVIHDELAGLISERMERTMYVLGIVATIFLPLSLLTGLLGINVGGASPASTSRWPLPSCARFWWRSAASSTGCSAASTGSDGSDDAGATAVHSACPCHREPPHGSGRSPARVQAPGALGALRGCPPIPPGRSSQLWIASSA